MTVKNILEHSNDIGWNTDQQIEIFLLLCKEHKPDLQAKLNVKKDNYVSFFKTQIYSCQQTTEISACQKFLTEFSRNPGQDFASCIQLFDSVYAHYSHLQAPKKKLEVQRSIEDLIIQITPFLLSDTAAKVFTSWAEDHSYGNQPSLQLCTN